MSINTHSGAARNNKGIYLAPGDAFEWAKGVYGFTTDAIYGIHGSTGTKTGSGQEMT